MSWLNRLLPIRLLAIVFPLFFLPGCSSVPVLPGHCIRDHGFVQALAERGGWTAQGRLAIRQGDDGWHVKLRWQQYPDYFRMQLDPVIGAGLRFEGTASRVSLSKSSGEPIRVGPPAQLLYEQTGFYFPVDQLRYWVLGLNGSGVVADAPLCATRFEQDGWEIEYGPFQLVDQVSLPRKVTITGDDIRVRLVVDNWDVSEL